MKNFIKEQYRYIIATAIAGVLTLYIWGLFSKEPIFFSLLSYLCLRVRIPFYVIICIFLFGACLASVIIFFFNKKSKTKFLDYGRDVMNGLVWDWSNYDSPRHFRPLCPKCLAELTLNEFYKQIFFKCISCGFVNKMDFSYDSLQTIVRIEIEKRERTEDWKKADKRIEEIKNKP